MGRPIHPISVWDEICIWYRTLVSDFLSSVDILKFMDAPTYLFTMLLLIGLALFTQDVIFDPSFY